MDAPARSLGRRWPESGSVSWRGQLPRELGETAARRLGVLGLVTAGTLAAFSVGHVLTSVALRERPPARLLVSVASALVLSLLMFGMTRWRREQPRLLLAAGLVYQLAMAVAIGVVDNVMVPQQVGDVRGWSALAVWILIFAVFIPSTPARTAWVSAVVAAVDPLTLLLDHALGTPLPPLVLMPQLFAPTLVAVPTAIIAARINYRAAKNLREARELGSYRLVELLGKGGMGEVWRAEHRMLARPAAIKLIRAEILAGNTKESAEGALRRFEREAQATALMQSEHTIAVYDFGTADDGSFYYVMELLDGLNLQDLVKQFGPMPPARAVHCLLGVCDSLAEAHAGGLIHRDIKPSNIFLCRKGLSHDCVKVLDFGLVTAATGAVAQESWKTASTQVAGTPAYMPPEIIEGGEVDGRADIYALGCVAYFLLSGRKVFEGSSATAVVLQHLREDAPRLGTKAPQPVPAPLEQLVHSCLEKNPARRPRSAAELRRLLQSVELESVWTEDAARAWWETIRRPAEKLATAPIDPSAVTASPTMREGPPR